MSAQKPEKRPFKIDFFSIATILLALFLAHQYWVSEQQKTLVAYSEYLDWQSKGEVSNVVVGPTTIAGTRKPPGKTSKPESFVVQRVDPEIATELWKKHITFMGEPAPGIVEQLMAWMLPAVALMLMWVYLLRPLLPKLGSGLMGVGKSGAKVYTETGVKVTFADVAGVEEAKQELAEIVGFLKSPQTYGRLGARVPKGVLLVGPPGTGKTLLARAIAGEAGVAFLSITGSEFVEMFVGVGAARVRDLFQEARTRAPAIIFIDELDALGRARGFDMPLGGDNEKEQTLNQLLAEMDGFDPSVGIIVLSATNRPEILDPALLRAGRFDRQILVDRPDRKGRAEILRVHLKKIQAVPDLDIDAIAAMTTGFTGADLANLVNEAALTATRRQASATTLDDFTHAIERIVAGIEKKSRILSRREREIVAHHEMGHALVALSLPGTDPIQKVSIIPRGLGALGYTMQRPTEDRFLLSRSELANRLAVLLGGRAAESIIYSEVSTGASDDLARATEIARDMVVRFGMSKTLGQATYEERQATFLNGHAPAWHAHNYSDETAHAIDLAVKDLVDEAFRTAMEILGRHRDLLESAAGQLLEHESLDQAQLSAISAKLREAKHRDLMVVSRR